MSSSKLLLIDLRSVKMPLREFILSQLRSVGINGKVAGREIKIRCPLGKHHDNSPSFQIRTDGSMVHCFGCDFGGNWNDLAEILHLERLSHDGYRTALKAKLEYMSDTEPPGNRFDVEPRGLWQGEWRGIREETLACIPSHIWFDDFGHRRILWPVTIYGRQAGWTAGWVDKGTEPKYLTLLEEGKIPFPFDLVHRICLEFGKEKLVLVEGQYDALRLIDINVPALAILGIEEKKDNENEYVIAGNIMSLIISLCTACNIKSIMSCFDRDAPGLRGTSYFGHTLKDSYKFLFRFPPENRKEGKGDVGNAPLEWLASIAKWYWQ